MICLIVIVSNSHKCKGPKSRHLFPFKNNVANAGSWSSGKTFVSIQTRAHRSLHSYVYRCVASYPVPTGPAWADGARASNVPTSGPEYRSDPLVVYCEYCTEGCEVKSRAYSEKKKSHHTRPRPRSHANIRCKS